MLFIVFGGAFIVLFLVGFSQLEKRAQLDEDLSATPALVPDPTAVRHMIRHERWGMLNMTWAFYTIVFLIDLSIPLLMLGLELVRLAEKNYFS